MKKTQRKRNDKTIFIIAVILFALAVGLFVGAYARFQTAVTGTATLRTAHWSFTVNGQTDTFAVDLTSGTVRNGWIQVTEGGETFYRIQPGTYGDFDLVLSAVGSDVDVTYTAVFGGLTGQVPANLALWADSAHTQPLASLNAGERVIPAGQQQTITIYWQWLYGATTDDTPFEGQTLTLPITITGYQVNPNP